MPPSLATPEFVVWALALRCRLREIDGWEDPERTERHLRSVRLVSTLRQAGRCREGVCLEDGSARRFTTHADSTEPLALREREALALFGGEQMVAEQCLGCPANAGAEDSTAWAGCHGILETPPDADGWRQTVEAVLASQGRDWTHLPQTSPRWYGLWSQGVLTPNDCSAVAKTIALSSSRFSGEVPGAAHLVRACESAASSRLSLHVRLYPAGLLEGRWWTPAPYCPECRAPQPTGSRGCQVCGRQGGPPPAEKRRARGVRPFRPLSDLFTPEEAAAFLRNF